MSLIVKMKYFWIIHELSYVFCVLTSSCNPRLMSNASSTSCIFSSDRYVNFSFSRFLSNVLICSSRITESLSSLYFFFSISTCVGIFALLILPVIAATITVGLYLLPVSFWMITTGLTPLVLSPVLVTNQLNIHRLF